MIYAIVKEAETAQERFERIQRKMMREHYDKLIEKQERLIDEAMRYMKHDAAFVFNFKDIDAEYSDEWVKEFRETATAYYLENGYKISNTTISW